MSGWPSGWSRLRGWWCSELTRTGSSVLSLRLAVTESGTSWREFIEDLATRGLAAPRLFVSDGHAGIRKAAEVWAESEVQRCTVHKWANLRDHCPTHARNDLRRDHNAIVYAADAAATHCLRSRRGQVAQALPGRGPKSRRGRRAATHLLPVPEAIVAGDPLDQRPREPQPRDPTQNQNPRVVRHGGKRLDPGFWGLIAFKQIRMQKIDGYRYLPQILDSQQVA